MIYQSEVEHVKKEVQFKLGSIVKTASIHINGDLHDIIHADEKGVPNLLEEFMVLQKQLEDISTLNSLHSKGSSLYTLRPKSTGEKSIYEFVIMDKKDPVDGWFIGNTISEQSHFSMVMSGNTYVTDIYQDEEGKWISAAAPIRNQEGKVVGLIQSDMHIDDYINLTDKKFINVTKYVLVGFIIILLLSCLGNAYLLTPLKIISKYIRNLSYIDFDKKLEIKSNDEFKDIANSINEMRKQLSKNIIDIDTLVLILNNLNVGVWIVDKGDRVLRANSHAISMQQGDKIGKLTQPLITYKDNQAFLKTFKGNIPVICSEMVYKENQTLYSIFDISKMYLIQKKLNESLEEQKNINNELQLRQKQLIEQEKMVSIGQLASGLAHEINNPIAYISSNIELMQFSINDLRTLQSSEESEDIYEDILDMLNDCQKGTKKVIEIVNGMRSFIYSSQNDEFVNTKVSSCIEAALLMLEGKYISKVTFNKNYVDDDLINIQPRRLTQVFLYMFVNSCEAIDENGIIDVKIYRENSECNIEINDNGRGIPSEHQNRIFEPFFTTKGPALGTGLGLYNVYQILSDHKGLIQLLKSDDKGTTFKITLPV